MSVNRLIVSYIFTFYLAKTCLYWPKLFTSVVVVFFFCFMPRLFHCCLHCCLSQFHQLLILFSLSFISLKIIFGWSFVSADLKHVTISHSDNKMNLKRESERARIWIKQAKRRDGCRRESGRIKDGMARNNNITERKVTANEKSEMDSEEISIRVEKI